MPHTLIVGRSGCGKTHYLLKFLNEKCRKKYENIYVVCPTFSINFTWQGWKFRNNPETHDVNRAIKEILGRHKQGRALIIFDDVATLEDVKTQTSELVKLGFSGKHHGIDTIVLTQQLTSIAKAYRENITFLVAFYTPGKRREGHRGRLLGRRCRRQQNTKTAERHSVSAIRNSLRNPLRMGSKTFLTFAR